MACLTHDVFDWIDTLPSRKTVDEAWSSFMEFCGAFGFMVGALADMPSVGENLDDTILCTSWPEGWLQHYIEKDYLRIDPTVAAMMFTFEPYTWKQSLSFANYEKASYRIFEEAADFGMADGYVIPIIGIKTGTGVVTVTGPATDLSQRQRASVHMAALYIHARIRELSPTKRPALELVHLSPRERECVQWAAVGKSDWEIAQILSISASTVATHMKHIARKFGVTSRMQTVVQALVSRSVFI